MTHEPMPRDRDGLTHKFKIHGEGFDGCPKVYGGYLTVGFYPDGRVGEIFIRFAKMGGRQGALLDAWAKGVSRELQRGTPLDELLDAYEWTGFPPAGLTEGPVEEIHLVSSPIDYVVKYLRARFCPEKEEES
jgi:ribonucleoside-diphosphate reductase alpha chain